MRRFACALAAVALGGFAMVGCEGEDATTASRTGTASTAPAVDVDVDINKEKIKDSAQRAGEAIKEAGRDTRDALNTAGQKVGPAIDRTVDRVRNTDIDVDVNTRRDGDGDAGGAQPAGARGEAGSDAADGVRTVLAQVTEAALTKGGLDDIAERLAAPDRGRLAQATDQNFADLDGRIEQFRNDWKAKYGQDFKIADEKQVLSNATFTIPQSATGRDPAERNDPGRSAATVQVQSGGGVPALTVPVVHEAPDLWRVDVPDTLTAEKLKANVLAHLTAANQMKDQWPADVNQAHAMVTHHVLMALMDKPAQQQ